MQYYLEAPIRNPPKTTYIPYGPKFDTIEGLVAWIILFVPNICVLGLVIVTYDPATQKDTHRHNLVNFLRDHYEV